VVALRPVRTSLIVTLAVLPIVCRAQANEDQKALDSFKSMVAHHVDSYQHGGREHVNKLGGGWAKERFNLDPASVTFDVEKTSSLVSPYVGTATFKLSRSLSAFHETEAEAAADDVLTKRDQTNHKHVFGYQDHQWKPTVRTFQYIGIPVLGDDFEPCDELLLKVQRPSEKDIHGCLEEFDDAK
jgi:hypothetical protein